MRGLIVKEHLTVNESLLCPKDRLLLSFGKQVNRFHARPFLLFGKSLEESLVFGVWVLESIFMSFRKYQIIGLECSGNM